MKNRIVHIFLVALVAFFQTAASHSTTATLSTWIADDNRLSLDREPLAPNPRPWLHSAALKLFLASFVISPFTHSEELSTDLTFDSLIPTQWNIIGTSQVEAPHPRLRQSYPPGTIDMYLFLLEMEGPNLNIPMSFPVTYEEAKRQGRDYREDNDYSRFLEGLALFANEVHDTATRLGLVELGYPYTTKLPVTMTSEIQSKAWRRWQQTSFESATWQHRFNRPYTDQRFFQLMKDAIHLSADYGLLFFIERASPFNYMRGESPHKTAFVEQPEPGQDYYASAFELREIVDIKRDISNRGIHKVDTLYYGNEPIRIQFRKGLLRWENLKVSSHRKTKANMYAYAGNVIVQENMRELGLQDTRDERQYPTRLMNHRGLYRSIKNKLRDITTKQERRQAETENGETHELGHILFQQSIMNRNALGLFDSKARLNGGITHEGLAQFYSLQESSPLARLVGFLRVIDITDRAEYDEELISTGHHGQQTQAFLLSMMRLYGGLKSNHGTAYEYLLYEILFELVHHPQTYRLELDVSLDDRELIKNFGEELVILWLDQERSDRLLLNIEPTVFRGFQTEKYLFGNQISDKDIVKYLRIAYNGEEAPEDRLQFYTPTSTNDFLRAQSSTEILFHKSA